MMCAAKIAGHPRSGVFHLQSRGVTGRAATSKAGREKAQCRVARRQFAGRPEFQLQARAVPAMSEASCEATSSRPTRALGSGGNAL